MSIDQGIDEINSMFGEMLRICDKKYSNAKLYVLFVVNCVLWLLMWVLIIVLNTKLPVQSVNLVGRFLIILCPIFVLLAHGYLIFGKMLSRLQRQEKENEYKKNFAKIMAEFLNLHGEQATYCMDGHTLDSARWAISSMLTFASAHDLIKPAKRVIKEYGDLPMIAQSTFDAYWNCKTDAKTYCKFATEYQGRIDSLLVDLYDICQPYISQSTTD